MLFLNLVTDGHQLIDTPSSLKQRKLGIQQLESWDFIDTFLHTQIYIYIYILYVYIHIYVCIYIYCMYIYIYIRRGFLYCTPKSCIYRWDFPLESIHFGVTPKEPSSSGENLPKQKKTEIHGETAVR